MLLDEIDVLNGFADHLVDQVAIGHGVADVGGQFIANAQNGIFQQTLRKLGIADTIKAMPTTTGEAVSAAVVNGTAEFGILPVSEILPVKGAEVAGTFPGETRSFIEMVGGVNAASAHAADARKLIQFLVSSQALPVLKKTGMSRN